MQHDPPSKKNRKAVNAESSGHGRLGVEGHEVETMNLLLREFPKAALNAFGDGPKTRNDNIIKVLTFLGTNPQWLEPILRGETQGAESFSLQIEALWWADARFDQELYPLSLRWYLMLLELPEPHRLDGIAQLARYRASFVAHKEALKLEHEAIGHALKKTGNPLTEETFNEAAGAVDNAIKLSKQFVSEESFAIVATYNTACGFGLKSRILAHKILLRSTRKFDSEFRTAHVAAQWKDSKNIDELWNKVGNNWRKHAEPDEIQKVDEYSRLAMKELNKLIVLATKDDEEDVWKRLKNHAADRFIDAWQNAAESDPDLVFLRKDAHSEKEFKDWQKNCDDTTRGSECNSNDEDLGPALAEYRRLKPYLEKVANKP